MGSRESLNADSVFGDSPDLSLGSIGPYYYHPNFPVPGGADRNAPASSGTAQGQASRTFATGSRAPRSSLAKPSTGITRSAYEDFNAASWASSVCSRLRQALIESRQHTSSRTRTARASTTGSSQLDRVSSYPAGGEADDPFVSSSVNRNHAETASSPRALTGEQWARDAQRRYEETVAARTKTVATQTDVHEEVTPLQSTPSMPLKEADSDLDTAQTTSSLSALERANQSARAVEELLNLGGVGSTADGEKIAVVGAFTSLPEPPLSSVQPGPSDLFRAVGQDGIEGILQRRAMMQAQQNGEVDEDIEDQSHRPLIEELHEANPSPAARTEQSSDLASGGGSEKDELSDEQGTGAISRFDNEEFEEASHDEEKIDDERSTGEEEEEEEEEEDEEELADDSGSDADEEAGLGSSQEQQRHRQQDDDADVEIIEEGSDEEDLLSDDEEAGSYDEGEEGSYDDGRWSQEPLQSGRYEDAFVMSQRTAGNDESTAIAISDSDDDEQTPQGFPQGSGHAFASEAQSPALTNGYQHPTHSYPDQHDDDQDPESLRSEPENVDDDMSGDDEEHADGAEDYTNDYSVEDIAYTTSQPLAKHSASPELDPGGDLTSMLDPALANFYSPQEIGATGAFHFSAEHQATMNIAVEALAAVTQPEQLMSSSTRGDPSYAASSLEADTAGEDTRMPQSHPDQKYAASSSSESPDYDTVVGGKAPLEFAVREPSFESAPAELVTSEQPLDAHDAPIPNEENSIASASEGGLDIDSNSVARQSKSYRGAPETPSTPPLPLHADLVSETISNEEIASLIAEDRAALPEATIEEGGTELLAAISAQPEVGDDLVELKELVMATQAPLSSAASNAGKLGPPVTNVDSIDKSIDAPSPAEADAQQETALQEAPFDPSEAAGVGNEPAAGASSKDLGGTIAAASPGEERSSLSPVESPVQDEESLHAGIANGAILAAATSGSTDAVSHEPSEVGSVPHTGNDGPVDQLQGSPINTASQDGEPPVGVFTHTNGSFGDNNVMPPSSSPIHYAKEQPDDQLERLAATATEGEADTYRHEADIVPSSLVVDLPVLDQSQATSNSVSDAQQSTQDVFAAGYLSPGHEQDKPLSQSLSPLRQSPFSQSPRTRGKRKLLDSHLADDESSQPMKTRRRRRVPSAEPSEMVFSQSQEMSRNGESQLADDEATQFLYEHAVMKGTTPAQDEPPGVAQTPGGRRSRPYVIGEASTPSTTFMPAPLSAVRDRFRHRHGGRILSAGAQTGDATQRSQSAGKSEDVAEQSENDEEAPYEGPGTRSQCRYHLLQLHNTPGKPIFVVPGCSLLHDKLREEGAEDLGQASRQHNEEKDDFDPEDLPPAVFQMLSRIVGLSMLEEVSILPDHRPAGMLSRKGSQDGVKRTQSPQAAIRRTASPASRMGSEPLLSPIVLLPASKRGRKSGVDPRGDLADYRPELEVGPSRHRTTRSSGKSTWEDGDLSLDVAEDQVMEEALDESLDANGTHNDRSPRGDASGSHPSASESPKSARRSPRKARSAPSREAPTRRLAKQMTALEDAAEAERRKETEVGEGEGLASDGDGKEAKTEEVGKKRIRRMTPKALARQTDSKSPSSSKRRRADSQEGQERSQAAVEGTSGGMDGKRKTAMRKSARR